MAFSIPFTMSKLWTKLDTQTAAAPNLSNILGPAPAYYQHLPGSIQYEQAHANPNLAPQPSFSRYDALFASWFAKK